MKKIALLIIVLVLSSQIIKAQTVVTNTVNGITTTTFTGAGSLTSATALLNGATVAIIVGYSTIGANAFSDAASLTSITIPASVTSIGSSAFSGASSLTSLTFKANSKITSIGASAFSGASSLTSITIPASVISIGASAYSGATNLTSLTFEANSKLTSIGPGAFSDSTSLTSITIPSSVTSIGNNAFSPVNLTTVTFEANSQLTTIGDYAFQSPTKLTSIAIPASVISIGTSAFSGSTNLASLTFEANSQLTSIGAIAFSGALSLTSITIPASVTSIGYAAFSGASSLTTVTFEDNSQLTSIENSAFSDAASLTSITIPASVSSIEAYAFKGAPSLSKVIFKANSQLTSIGGYAFSEAASLTSISIPARVTYIEKDAFSGSSLTIVYINGKDIFYNQYYGYYYYIPSPATNVSFFGKTVQTRLPDTTAPVLTQVTPIPTPSYDTTPSYVFSTSEAGTLTTSITQGFSTSASVTSASNQTVTFNALPAGTYTGKTITVTDATGNARSLTIPNFVIDTTAPVLTLVTPIPTPSKNTTPSFVFTTSESGTLTSSLGFSTSASVTTGSNQTVTFNALPDGTYTGKIITVTNAAGNARSLIIPDFVIDTTAPVLTQVTPIPTPSNDTTPSFVFTTSESGTLTSSLGFSTSASVATGSNRTVTFTALPDGTYTGKTITITDAAGNASSLIIPDFVIDTIAPVLTQVTPIPTPSNDTTPSYVFTTSEAGTFTSSLVFSTSALVTFNALPAGTYTQKTITVTDAAGNASSIIIPDFVINTTLDTASFDTIGLKLYPNPTSSVLHLNVGNNLTNQPYKIVDTLGKVILKGNLNEGDNSINVEQLSKGIYYLKVSDKNASKFIKE